MEQTVENTPKRVWRAGSLTYTAPALALLCFWMLWGDFTWAMKDRAVWPSATLLIKQIGVSDFVFGLVIVSFPNFTNTFLSPIIGYVSDRHRGRWGRRIPFLMFTTPFIVLGLYGLGFCKTFGGLLHEAIPAIPPHASILIFFCIAWMMLDFGTTLSASLFGALANDVIPPEMLGRFFGLFRIVSLGAGMIFNGWLLEKVEGHTLEIFLGLGTLYGIGLTMLCLKVKEGKYPPPEEPAPPAGYGRRIGVFFRVMRSVVTYFRQSFSLPYYRWYMLAWAIAGLAFTPINFFSIQYAQKLRIGMDRYGLYLVITYTCSLLLSYFLGMLSDRFHPLRTGIAALLVYGLLMFVSFPLIVKAEHFGVLFVLHGVVSGCYFTFTASLGARLLPRPLFAQFASATSIIAAFFSMVFGPLLGLTLDLLDNDYRTLFLIAGGISLVGALLLLKVYSGFKAYGGDAAYRPPMPE